MLLYPLIPLSLQVLSIHLMIGLGLAFLYFEQKRKFFYICFLNGFFLNDCLSLTTNLNSFKYIRLKRLLLITFHLNGEVPFDGLFRLNGLL